MRLFFYTLCIALFFSCSKGDEINANEHIVGKWQLIETLADPGDGSGVFLPVTSDFVIEFLSDGTFQANGKLCDVTIASGDPSTGKYDTETMELILENCDIGQPETTALKWPYLFEEGKLIVQLLCIEPCGMKFEKID